ncbi:hypothetical protein LguiA_005379 [Lonicera macranthoides]
MFSSLAAWLISAITSSGLFLDRSSPQPWERLGLLKILGSGFGGTPFILKSTNPRPPSSDLHQSSSLC